MASSVYHLSELVLITHTNYAIGGERTTHYYKVVEDFNPMSNTWTQIPDMLIAGYQAGACALDGKLQESLSFSEKDTRLKNLHHSLQIVKQQVHRLRAKIGQLLENEGVSPQDDDGTDMPDIFTECSTSIDKRYPTESAQ